MNLIKIFAGIVTVDATDPIDNTLKAENLIKNLKNRSGGYQMSPLLPDHSFAEHDSCYATGKA